MATARVDVDKNQFDEFIDAAVRSGIAYQVVSMEGPGGGNPCVDLSDDSRDRIKSFLLEYYDPEMVDEDFALYCSDDRETSLPSP
jgi:hypothetical protein